MSDDDLDEQSPDDGLLPTEQPTVDAGSRKDVRKRANRQELLSRQEEQFWTEVFSHEVGRRVMWGLLIACGTFEQVFMIGPNGFPQPEATWFKAGEQNFGLRMYRTWLRNHHEGVALMHVENDPDFKPKVA